MAKDFARDVSVPVSPVGKAVLLVDEEGSPVTDSDLQAIRAFLVDVDGASLSKVLTSLEGIDKTLKDTKTGHELYLWEQEVD